MKRRWRAPVGRRTAGRSGRGAVTPPDSARVSVSHACDQGPGQPCKAVLRKAQAKDPIGDHPRRPVARQQGVAGIGALWPLA